jgi:perosamine synthetase
MRYKLNNFIPVNEPVIGELERKLLMECIDSGWISSEGPFIKCFEETFSSRVNRKFGIAVSSGTAALEVAVAALKIGVGDEVIMPTFTIISCPLAVVRCGAIPILIDSDPITWNMDVEQIEAKISPKTRAIMVVHIYGLPVNMEPILELAERYGLYVIEDAAEMHGQTWKGKPCGSFGDISVFSFYPNKHVTTGEGGMLVTNDYALAERCRSLRNLCFLPGRRFVHEELGWNYRMTSMQAALGLAQLQQLDNFVIRKRRMGAFYRELLNGTPGLSFAPERSKDSESIYWVYGLILRDELQFEADEVTARLENLGIATRPFFWPIHEQPVFQRRGWFKDESYPAAERMARRGFYIPSGLGITEMQQIEVVNALKEVMNELI